MKGAPLHSLVSPQQEKALILLSPLSVSPVFTALNVIGLPGCKTVGLKVCCSEVEHPVKLVNEAEKQGLTKVSSICQRRFVAQSQSLAVYIWIEACIFLHMRVHK